MVNGGFVHPSSNGAPVSGRKVRAAVGTTIGVVQAHAKALDDVIADIQTIGGVLAEHADEIDALAARLLDLQRASVLPAPDAGFWGRLRWLLRGHA